MGGRVASPTFVGRLEDLQTLEAARVRAANTEPAVVLVGGEAGVGKTRLIAELTSRCAADGTRVLAGGCVPVGDGALPYAPIVEALRVLLGDVGVGAVRELVGPSWPELARLAPGLGEPQSSPTGEAVQARLFELLLGLLGRLGEQAPLVLVVEDVHWADRSTRDLLAFLVRNLRWERVLLVVTYRSDETGQARLGPFLAELARDSSVERIELPRFQRPEVVAQLTGILGAAPDAELVDAVFVRSEGNPFFTEELVAARQAGASALPETLRDLLQGRVERLSEQAQHVLGVAAVAGRRVPHGLLDAVAGLGHRQLARALREAVDQQLLVTQPGWDGYEFRHGLLQEVVYAGLLPGERTRLHSAYARALTARPGLADGSPAVAAAELAAHWEAAGDFPHALPAVVQAGRAAARSHAFPEAHRAYERALELWTRVPEPESRTGVDQIELLTRAAETAGFAGRPNRALMLLTRALDGVDPAAEPMRAALLHMRLGDQSWVAGNEPGCLAALADAVRILPPGPSTERARVLANSAQWLMMAGRHRDAIARATEALEVARTVGARAEEGHALDILGSCTYDTKPLVEARRIAEEVGNAEGIARAYLNLSAVLSNDGRERDALDNNQRGLAAARELGIERAIGSYLAADLALNLYYLGDWPESERVIAQALEREATAAPRLYCFRALLAVGRGDFESARKDLTLAKQLSPGLYEQVGPLPGLAELAIWEHHYDAARAAVDEGLGVLAELGTDHEQPAQEFGLFTLELCTLGLRAEADQAELAQARRSAAGVNEAERRAESLLATVHATTGQQGQAATTKHAWLPSYTALAEAEYSRLKGRSDPQLWQQTAESWERLELPYLAAYAHFREAEALLAAKAPRTSIDLVIRAVHHTTLVLGAMPLQRELESLARRGRVRLNEQVTTVAEPEPSPSTVASLGLTQRETEVLVLLAEGWTNRQIGQELFITAKTASVHVSRILAKLGVAGRGEAAAVAHRLGLDKP
jgi:DNA-binding CsgD family transcriptional regulator/tetratricopeptide (TPR) repeat protein